MPGQLADIPTDTLIDMLFVFLSNDVSLTASDVAEIIDIQCELQRRGDRTPGSWQFVN
jgi:hypothetical protein